jgi:hypothetical protein
MNNIEAQRAAVETVHHSRGYMAEDCAWSAGRSSGNGGVAVTGPRIEFAVVIRPHVDSRGDSVQLTALDRPLQLFVADTVPMGLCPRENSHVASVPPPSTFIASDYSAGDNDAAVENAVSVENTAHCHPCKGAQVPCKANASALCHA